MTLTDREITQNVRMLRELVGAWLKKHRLARDAYLRTFQEHFDNEPDLCPAALVLCYDNELVDVFSGYGIGSEEILEDLERILTRLRFCWERYDNLTVTFHPTDNVSDYYEYFRFQWLCSFIEPGMKDISGQVFGHFKVVPGRLLDISPRSLEVVLDAAFQAQGFRTELGSGSGDGGVDIRLYQHDVIGEVQTLVQVKRYAKHRPIRLDAVAALRALVSDQRAHRGLFVTTSRYLRSARRFADRQGRLIQLADTSDMVRWCERAESSVNTATDLSWLDALCARAKGGMNSEGLVGNVVHATWGHNMTINDFALVARESPGAVLLAPIKKRVVSDDGYGQVGKELPEFILKDEIDAPPVFLARKSNDQSKLYFWGRGRLYSVWDGNPQWFNYMD